MFESATYSKVNTHKSQPADEKEGHLKRSATFMKKIDLEKNEFEQIPPTDNTDKKELLKK